MAGFCPVLDCVTFVFHCASLSVNCRLYKSV